MIVSAMLNAGLTGGIASGKSTVSDLFREKGAFLIDHDLITREVQVPGSGTLDAIARAFGEEVLNADRTLNREKLGRIVFSSAERLEALNAIVHPAVRAEWMAQISRIERERPDAVIISDIPLLIEVGWHKEVDLVILVLIPREEQVQRLMNRNGYSLEEARRRLAAQMPIEEKAKYADFVIDNSGPLERTRREVDQVWLKLLELERKKREKRQAQRHKGIKEQGTED